MAKIRAKQGGGEQAKPTVEKAEAIGKEVGKEALSPDAPLDTAPATAEKEVVIVAETAKAEAKEAVKKKETNMTVRFLKRHSILLLGVQRNFIRNQKVDIPKFLAVKLAQRNVVAIL